MAGLDFGYDVVNYELVADDPNTLSLQHFDGDYNDSSVYGRSFYSQNRSTTYVDSGAFGKAVSLLNGSAAGVTIPGLSGHNSLSFDFRVYYNDISSLGVYFGDTNIFQEIVPGERRWVGQDAYTDNGLNALYGYAAMYLAQSVVVGTYYSPDYLLSIRDRKQNFNWKFKELSTAYKSRMPVPGDYLSPGFVGASSYASRYGWHLLQRFLIFQSFVWRAAVLPPPILPLALLPAPVPAVRKARPRPLSGCLSW